MISQRNSNNARQKAGGSECVCKVNSEILIMNLEGKENGMFVFWDSNQTNTYRGGLQSKRESRNKHERTDNSLPQSRMEYYMSLCGDIIPPNAKSGANSRKFKF